MSINWTQLEENAKKVAAADKKKNPKGYVGSASAPSVSTKKTTKTSSSSSTKNLKTKSGGKNKSNKTTTQKTNGKKSGLVQGKGSNADKQLTTKANESKRNSTIKSRQLPTSTKNAMKESKYRNFVAGVGDAVIDNSPVGIGYSLAKGSKLSDSDLLKSDKVTKGTSEAAKKAQQAGEVAGTIGSYLTAYGAAGKATGKAAAKLVGSKAGQKAVAKAATTKLGTKAGKEAVEATAKSIAKDVVADATIGSVMDLGQARSEGLEGTDLAKYMAQQAALNAVLGGAAEAAAPTLKAVGKTAKKATDYHWEPRIVNGKTKYFKVKNGAEGSDTALKTKSAKNSEKDLLKTEKAATEEVVDESKKVAQTGDLGAKKGNEEVIEQTADTGETVYKKVDAEDEEYWQYLASQAEDNKDKYKVGEKKKERFRTGFGLTDRQATLPKKQSANKQDIRKLAVAEKDGWEDPVRVKNRVEEFAEKAKKGTVTEDDKWDLAYCLAYNAQEVVPLDDTIRALQKDIRSAQFGMSAQDKAEFADGFDRWHKDNFGNFKVKDWNDNGTRNRNSFDVFYQELLEMYPGLLDENAWAIGDQIAEAQRVLNMTGDVYKLADRSNIDEVAEMFYESIDDKLTKEYKDYTGKLRSVPKRTIPEDTKFVDLPTKSVSNAAEDTRALSDEYWEQMLKDVDDEFIDNTEKLAENGTESLEKAEETPLNRNPIKTDADGKQTVGGFEVEGSNLGIVNSSEELGEAIEAVESWWKKAYRNLVNRQAAIDDLAKASGNDAVADAVQAVRSANGTTEYILTRNLVSPEGEILLDKSYASLFEGMSDSDRELFNEYAQNLNNIARWAQDKPLDASVTAEMSQKRVDEILALRPDFAQRTADINEWWNTFTHSWLVGTGRMTEDAWQAMTSKYPNYVPAFMPKKGNKGGVKTGFGKFSVKSGTHEAKAGTTLERMPIEDAFMEQISQIVSGSRKNNLIVSVIDTLKSDPDALKHFGIAKDVNDIPMTNFDVTDLMTQWEKDSMEKVSDKVYTISGMQNGQKVMAYISADMADAIGTMNKIIDSAPAAWFAKGGKLITNPMKGAITQLNPLFAIANLSRDIPTALIQSQYGVGTTAKNMFKAVKEIATNGEYWQKYMAMGGKSSGYIKANSGFKKNLAANKTVGQQMWEGLKTVFGAAGEATESVPRLAEFISSLENGNSVYKALTDSAEVTVNFSRAGAVTKTLDAWVMYLNAAVQGLDKFARTMKNAPLRTATSSLAVVGAPYAMLTAYNWANPNYQDLSDRTKQNYFCIPNLMGEVDENGYAKTFIKVPLNREYGTIFASTMDVIAGYMSGEENPWNGYLDTVRTNFLPSDVTTGNVLAPLRINLPQNKDFAGRNIVSSNLEDVSPQYQYDGTTSGAAMALANIANRLGIPSDTLKSPQKVDYLLDSYGGYFGSLAQAATDQGNQGVLDTLKGLTIDPVEDRFTADARYSSGVQQAFYDAKEKATTAWNDIKVTTGEKGKEYIEYKTYNAIQQELSDLSKQEKEILNDTSLSNAEKSKQAKAIREQKNEVARGAKERVAEAVKEYEENPEYTMLSSSQKESYESKYEGTGISKEDYAEAKELTQGINSNTAEAFVLASNGMDADAVEAMTSSNAYEKAKDLKRAGATKEDVINAAKTIKESGYTRNIGKAYALLSSGQKSSVVSVLVSDSAVEKAKAIKRAGITPEQLDTVAEKLDTNNNGYYSNDELKSYLNSANMSQEKKYAVFEALKSNAKTANPY